MADKPCYIFPTSLSIITGYFKITRVRIVFVNLSRLKDIRPLCPLFYETPGGYRRRAPPCVSIKYCSYSSYSRHLNVFSLTCFRLKINPGIHWISIVDLFSFNLLFMLRFLFHFLKLCPSYNNSMCNSSPMVQLGKYSFMLEMKADRRPFKNSYKQIRIL